MITRISSIFAGMDFAADYVLENDAVLLRPLQRSDLEHLLIFALNEQDLWKFSNVPVAGEENMRKYIEATISAREAGKRICVYCV